MRSQAHFSFPEIFSISRDNKNHPYLPLKLRYFLLRCAPKLSVAKTTLQILEIWGVKFKGETFQQKSFLSQRPPPFFFCVSSDWLEASSAWIFNLMISLISDQHIYSHPLHTSNSRKNKFNVLKVAFEISGGSGLPFCKCFEVWWLKISSKLRIRQWIGRIGCWNWRLCFAWSSYPRSEIRSRSSVSIGPLIQELIFMSKVSYICKSILYLIDGGKFSSLLPESQFLSEKFLFMLCSRVYYAQFLCSGCEVIGKTWTENKIWDVFGPCTEIDRWSFTDISSWTSGLVCMSYFARFCMLFPISDIHRLMVR